MSPKLPLFGYLFSYCGLKLPYIIVDCADDYSKDRTCARPHCHYRPNVTRARLISRRVGQAIVGYPNRAYLWILGDVSNFLLFSKLCLAVHVFVQALVKFFLWSCLVQIARFEYGFSKAGPLEGLCVVDPRGIYLVPTLQNSAFLNPKDFEPQAHGP